MHVLRVMTVIAFLGFCLPLQARAQAAPTVPSGTIIAFAGKTASPPKGWLPCDGQELDVGKYKELFAAIGTIYGGDGVKKFRLPNLQGRVVVGAGHAAPLSDRVLAQTGGEETHTLTPAEMPAHVHLQTSDDPTGAQGGQNQRDGNGGSKDGGVDNGTTRTAGGSDPHNTMPPFLVLNYLIKT